MSNRFWDKIKAMPTAHTIWAQLKDGREIVFSVTDIDLEPHSNLQDVRDKLKLFLNSHEGYEEAEIETWNRFVIDGRIHRVK